VPLLGAGYDKRPISAASWINENTFNGGGMLAMPGQSYFSRRPLSPRGNNRGANSPTIGSPISRPTPCQKQWAKDVMKKDNEEILNGQDRLHGTLLLRSAGVPGFDQFASSRCLPAGEEQAHHALCAAISTCVMSI